MTGYVKIDFLLVDVVEVVRKNQIRLRSTVQSVEETARGFHWFEVLAC